MRFRPYSGCLLLVAILVCSNSFAQVKKTAAKPKPKADTTAAKKDSLADAIKGKKKIEGLFTLYMDTVGGSLQMLVKKDQINKEYIYQSFSMGGPGSLFLNQNMLRETWVFKIKRSYNRLDFLRCNSNFYYDPSNAVSKAANVDVSDAVFYADKIIAEDSTGYLVKVDGLFISDKLDPVKPNFPPNLPPGAVFNLGSFNSDKSSYEKINSFPKNTDVTVCLAYDNPTPMNYGDKSITDARYVRVRMQHSIIEMPQNDFKPRYDDPRVGYFTQEQDDMTSTKSTPFHDMITRWNLVKKDPNAALSEPVEPIVWWVENTTPVELRQIILDAGAKWNESFEKAGFKNAVVMKMMPDNADWDPADIRYNVIRWVSSDLGYAIGPSFINPRTGQILGADITIDYGFMGGILSEQSLYRAMGTTATIGDLQTVNTNSSKNFMNCTIGKDLQVQFATGTMMAECIGGTPADLDSLRKQFFTELVLHEMGHTMGLMHNMKSSQMLSPDELNDPAITRKWGLTGSVMDYSIVNAAADHSKQGDYYTTKVGPYDDWAIEYGYSVFPAGQEEAGLQKILSRSNDPHLTFGNDADIAGYESGIDPRVNVWDMSNDMVTYSANRFKLVNELMGKIKDRYAVSGSSYADFRVKYSMLMGQRFNMSRCLSRYIGGVYVDRSFSGQSPDSKPFTPVPADYQKKAMAILSNYIFAPNAFDADAPLIPYLQRQRRGYNFFGTTEDPKVDAYAMGLQSQILYYLLDNVTMARINRTSLYGNSYSCANVLTDLNAALFDADLKTSVNLYRQNIQTEYVKMLADILNKGENYDNASRACALSALKGIREKLQRASSGDDQSKAHRDNLQFLIDKALVIK